MMPLQNKIPNILLQYVYIYKFNENQQGKTSLSAPETITFAHQAKFISSLIVAALSDKRSFKRLFALFDSIMKLNTL